MPNLLHTATSGRESQCFIYLKYAWYPFNEYGRAERMMGLAIAEPYMDLSGVRDSQHLRRLPSHASQNKSRMKGKFPVATNLFRIYDESSKIFECEIGHAAEKFKNYYRPSKFWS